MKAILLISHGSRWVQTKKEILDLIDILRASCSGAMVEYAFLEMEHPSIPDAIETCVSQGAKHVVVVLNFLNSGRHVCEDIPALIDSARQKYPHVRFVLTSPVGQHPKIVNLFMDLIDHAQ